MPLPSRLLLGAGFAGIAVGLGAAPAFAATGSFTPGNPLVADYNCFDEATCPGVPVTVTGTGFKPNSDVYIALCKPDATLSAQCAQFEAADPAPRADASGNVTYNLVLHQTTTTSDGSTPFPAEPISCNTTEPGANNCVLRLFSGVAPVDVAGQGFVAQLPVIFQSAVVPETPYALLLPLGALTCAAGAYAITRRRRTSVSAEA